MKYKDKEDDYAQAFTYFINRYYKKNDFITFIQEGRKKLPAKNRSLDEYINKL